MNQPGEQWMKYQKTLSLSLGPCWLTLLVTWNVGLSTLAQDEFEVGLQDEEEVAGPEQPQKHIGIDNFDRWVFGQWGTSRAARKQLQSQLTLQVEAIDRVCDLTTVQQEKLQLAGQGDIWRFYERVEEVRKIFFTARLDQQKINQIWQHIQPLQQQLQAGLFHPHSLLHKCILRTLNPHQAARYQRQEFVRRQFHYETSIALTLEMLQEGIPLRESQQRQLTRLIHDSTELPDLFGQYDSNLILWHLGQLPEEELKPMFDRIQWQAMKKTFRQVQAMQPHLRKMGVLP
jgi:hypothetical protein